MDGLINKNYPFDFGLRKRLVISMWTGIGIFLFILFFQPFGIVASDINNYLLLIAGFGGISIILQLVIHLSIPLGKLSFRLGQYNLNILMLFELLILILCSVAFSFYLRYVGGVKLSIFLVFRIVIVCLLVPVANMLIYEIHDLKLRLKPATKEEKPAKTDNVGFSKHIVELRSNNRAEKIKLSLERLLFVKSAENYVEVHYLDKGQAKMKLLRTTLKNVVEVLHPYPQILRCHRTFLVNLENVLELKRSKGVYTLSIQNHNEALPVSRQYLLQVKDALTNHV